MKIVARNSLTLSNVNDGTITHTAYSYSVDGKDRFSTVYPKPNLLNGTKIHDIFKGTGTANAGGTQKYILDKGLKISDLKLSKYQDLIFEFDWKATGTNLSGYFLYQTQTYCKGTRVTISPTNTSGHVKNTFYKLPVTTDISTFMTIRQDNIPTTVTVEISNVMMYIVDYSPWMPSSTEVKTSDYPSYIGQYTNDKKDDKTNPSDYTWSLMRGNDGKDGATGKDGTSGIIVSSVAPDSPHNGQLWQDTSTTPHLVKKWTGSSWVIWELYAQNLKADSLSALTSVLGDVTAGTVKLMDNIDVNGTLKKYGIYQSKFGLISSGPTFATPSAMSDSQMGVANLNKGELRFIVNNYTEDLKNVQASGMSDKNNAFINFKSYEKGKDVMMIGSSGDIVFKGITSQDTPWIEMSKGTYYKNMFSRVYISYSIKATSTANIPLGVLPIGLRPFRGLHLTANAWATILGNDRHIEVRPTGEVTLYNPVNGANYDGEVSFTL